LSAETRNHRVEPDITVFGISGRLTLGNPLQSVESEIRELIDSGARKLVIDLTGLNTIDSSGVGTLIICGEHMDRLGGRMRLAGAHGSVAKIFNTIHIDRVIPLDADLGSACGSFSSAATV
jgi:anti-sigma B factor antagonist